MVVFHRTWFEDGSVLWFGRPLYRQRNDGNVNSFVCRIVPMFLPRLERMAMVEWIMKDGHMREEEKACL